jgi:hypothetical protein
MSNGKFVSNGPGRSRTGKQRLALLSSLMQQLQAASKQELIYKLDQMVDFLSRRPQVYDKSVESASGKSHADYIDWLKDVRREVQRA